MAALLVALPWINPAAYGPSAAAIPWLVSAASVLALWGVASRGFRLQLVPPVLAWLAAATVLWAALSQFTVRPELAMLAGGLAVVVLAVAVARNAELACALQAGLLAAAAVNALFGFVQYFGGSAALSPVVNLTVPGEIYGNLRQTNQFATLCWMGAAIVLFGTLHLPRAAATTLLVLLAAACAATGSRTGVLEGIALATLAAWWRGPERRGRLVLAGIAAVAYVSAALLLPLLLEAATGIASDRTLWARLGAGDPCISRRVLWSNVLHLVALKPLAGWGWGELDYAHFLTLYPGARFCEILDNAHNLPLHLAVELGAPAALLACGGALFWAWRQRPWAEAVPLRRLAWVVLALVLLHSLLEYPLWYGPFQIAAGLALGWLLPVAAAAVVVPRRGAAAAVLLGAALAYAAFDYARVSQAYIEPEARWRPWRKDTLKQVRASWLFSGQARFADFTLATPTRANAQEMYALSQQVLHYSPEPRVIEGAIESAVLAGREDEALLHLVRFRAAFPAEYENWRARQRQPLPAAP
ncbi:MAG TPA: Wzy polymerase domain-containing protein [Ramlibacter sp.]|uniref:PglL family O-oligosaccharyltransferase n=1 Tax=Ramlibacter sp. TaxID=1917967 RepID=UPI002ED1949D